MTIKANCEIVLTLLEAAFLWKSKLPVTEPKKKAILLSARSCCRC